MEDKEIIRLFFERKEQAITESDAKYGSYCFVIANNILANREDSEEMVNDTWFKAWNVIPPVKPNILRAFFAKITRNLSLNRWDADHAKKRGEGEVPLAIDELSECVPDSCAKVYDVDSEVIRKAIGSFLAELSESERKLFVRRYWYLDPIKKLAEDTGLKESNIKMTLLRSRNKLRVRLEQEGIAL